MYIQGDLTELHKQMEIERDMLNGNLNRIMICDDLEELNSMFLFAVRRINSIYEIKRQCFLNDSYKNKNKGVIL